MNTCILTIFVVIYESEFNFEKSVSVISGSMDRRRIKMSRRKEWREVGWCLNVMILLDIGWFVDGRWTKVLPNKSIVPMVFFSFIQIENTFITDIFRALHFRYNKKVLAKSRAKVEQGMHSYSHWFPTSIVLIDLIKTTLRQFYHQPTTLLTGARLNF